MFSWLDLGGDFLYIVTLLDETSGQNNPAMELDRKRNSAIT